MNVLKFALLNHCALQSDQELQSLYIDTDVLRLSVTFDRTTLDTKVLARGLRELADKLDEK